MKPTLLGLTLLFALPAGAQNKITTRILDQNNTPIAGAHISAMLFIQWDKPLLSQVTGADGTATFDIPNDLDGKMAVGNFCVTKPGFAFANWGIWNKNQEIHLNPGVTAQGKVVDEAGKPISDVSITLQFIRKSNDPSPIAIVYGREGHEAYTVKSGADGSFKMADLPADSVALCDFLHPDFARELAGSVATGAENTIKLAAAGKVRGRVLDLAGKPVVGAKVSVFPMGRRGSGNDGRTDANGVYSIGSLIAGSYRVAISTDSKLGVIPYVFARIKDVPVEAGKTREAPEARAQTGFIIRGLARDAVTQKPLANVDISAKGGKTGEENYSSGYTDATGHFVIRVVPDNYRVSVSRVIKGYAVPAPQNVANGEQKELLFSLPRAKILRGVTVDEAGKPVQGKLKTSYYGTIEANDLGQWEYQPTDDRPVPISGGETDDGYFEVVSNPATLNPAANGLITIVLRKKTMQVLPGRALTSDGKPLEGVQIQGHYSYSVNDGNRLETVERQATTNANGDFVLTGIRDGIRAGSNFFEVSGKKDGYAFQKGGFLSKNGPVWQITDLIFTPLNLKIVGSTLPGARVTAGGLETIADAKGAFLLEGLPATQKSVWVYKDADFGSGQSPADGAPLTIELKPQTSQPRDVALARQIWREMLDENAAAGKTMYEANWIERHMTDTPPDFQAQLAKATGGDPFIANVIRLFAGKANAATLEPAIMGLKDADWRAYAAITAGLKSSDKEFAARMLQQAEAAFKTKEADDWMRETNLYSAAALAAKVQGEDAGISALDRALVVTLKQHPQESVVKDATEVTTGRNDMMVRQVETLAEGGLPLVRRLMQNLDPDSGDEASALNSAIPVLARRDGVQSVLPLLDEIEKMPEPGPNNNPERGRRVSQSPKWSFAQAAVKIMPALAKESPEQALQLARRVTTGEVQISDPAKALALAAKAQKPEVAAPLWREVVKMAAASTAPRYAAQAFQLDPQLGRELFEVAFKKVENESKSDFVYQPLWAIFCFYNARNNPAQSRFILEREWAAARRKSTEGDQLSALAMAMAAIDANRAWEMAKDIPKDNFSTSLDTRRRIGVLLNASDELRADFPFNRQENWDEWSAMDEE